MKRNKVFRWSCNGHYIGAYGVVIAPTIEEATALIREELRKEDLPGVGFEISEVDTKNPHAVILFNGDY